ncbi:hypothetical protein PVAP13_9NG765877 [Panicum virgatum]|uniref:Uncharacterized protein n=1 Tax=Panicum virgatum TaxID=38727 RepID=A0A8T0N9G3_PANVG|nr:hypothetical protein PVAP13_9NG765877 [Panicum virgatum]
MPGWPRRAHARCVCARARALCDSVSVTTCDKPGRPQPRATSCWIIERAVQLFHPLLVLRLPPRASHRSHHVHHLSCCPPAPVLPCSMRAWRMARKMRLVPLPGYQTGRHATRGGDPGGGGGRGLAPWSPNLH